MKLPASLDHILAFIYLAYSMMALLYETVPAFEDTWIESLGGLGRYRMAIEDDDIRDRDVWTGVVSRRGIELGHRLLLLKRTQGEKDVVGRLHAFYLQKKVRPNWDRSRD
jgi:hypothetical protein